MLPGTQGIAAISLVLLLAACSGDDTAETANGDAGTLSADLQRPPQGAQAIEAWLETGAYKKWRCEPSAHESRDPSPHGFNRICSNALISDNAAASDDWPEGAAAVKEMYASGAAKSPVGYAVYIKTAADSGGGDHWYWYERVPLDSPVPHDSHGTVADGMGDSGSAKTICVGCHVAAGSDQAHTPSEGGRDQVYTPVR